MTVFVGNGLSFKVFVWGAVVGCASWRLVVARLRGATHPTGWFFRKIFV
jgi:hypothetical protein